MNTPPKFSHSRQGSVDNALQPTGSSSAAHLGHSYLSATGGSHTPGHHSPLTHYGHALASLAYPSPNSYSPYRASQTPIPAWASANTAALHPTSARSESREIRGEDEEDEEDDDDDDSDDDDDDDEEDDDDDELDNSKDVSGTKRKRDASPKGNSAKKASTSKGKAGEASGKKDSKKQKPTRGARACTNCRRLKMRCVGAESGPPCNRCRNGNHDCVFEESNRGKKGGKNQKAEAMQQSLRKMEQTLATVLRSIRDPGLAAQHGGMVTRSPSPTDANKAERANNDSHASRDPRSTHSFNGDFGPRSPWNRLVDPYASAGAAGSRHSNDGASPAMSTVNPNAVAQRSSSSTETSGPSPAAHTTRFLEPLPHHRAGRPAQAPNDSDRSRSSRGSPRLHSLPDNTLNPLGLLAEASLHNNHRSRHKARAPSDSSTKEKESQRSGSSTGQTPDSIVKIEAEDRDKAGAQVPQDRTMPLGVASGNYFKPGPMTILPLRRIIIERQMPPELLTAGIVTSEEVLDLFRIFFKHCGQHLLLLDADWHTPTFICSRSPFLFTCVCTVAAKFYSRRPDLHAKCQSLVKKVAFEVVNRGFKSIEIVQGFLLMAMWAQPAERFEEDRTWMYSGIALRMATDLNLHRKSVATFNHDPHPEDPAVLDREREILNRERTWYVCFSIDRGLSAQMGKPYTVREDWIIRNCRNWGGRFSRVWDIGISALADLHRLHSRQLDFLYSSTTSVSGLNTEIDYSLVLPIFNEQLNEWREVWRWRGLFDVPPEAQKYLDRQERKKLAALEAKTAVANGVAAKAEKPEAPKKKSKKARMADADEEEDELDLNTRILLYVVKQAPIRFSSAVLVLNSFGLQQSVDHPTGGDLDRAQYFAKCMEAAKLIVTQNRDHMREELCYAPDTQFVNLAYACVFLLKLIRPAFAGYVDEDSVVSLVQDAVDLLDEIAINDTHTPYLYASFLRALLQSRKEHTVGSKSASGSRVASRAATPQFSGVEETPVFDMSATNENMPAPGHAGDSLTQTALEGHSADFNNHLPATGDNGTGWNASLLGITSGLDDFWGSLLPPGFAQSSVHDIFGTAGAEGTTNHANPTMSVDAETAGTPQNLAKFGMGGGSAFDFGGGAIGNGNGGVPLSSAAASAAMAGTGVTPSGGHYSGANTPHARSRRSSATGFGLSQMQFDVGY